MQDLETQEHILKFQLPLAIQQFGGGLREVTAGRCVVVVTNQVED